MDDPGGVRPLHPREHAKKDGFSNRQRDRMFPKITIEGRARHILHQHGRGVVDVQRIDDLHDVGVLESAQNTCFEVESLAESFVALVQHLERAAALEHPVADQEHRGHAALSQLRQHAVAVKLVARRKLAAHQLPRKKAATPSATPAPATPKLLRVSMWLAATRLAWGSAGVGPYWLCVPHAAP